MCYKWVMQKKEPVALTDLGQWMIDNLSKMRSPSPEMDALVRRDTLKWVQDPNSIINRAGTPLHSNKEGE